MRFLHSIAEGFFNIYGEAISELIFVMPNRRSSLFFTKELALISKTPLYSPKVVTFHELLVELSQFRECDSVELIVKLYESYCDIADQPQNFDSFLEWGEVALSDFSEVDSYLVDPEQLYTNIRDLKEIDSDLSFLTSEQREAISSFWGVFWSGDRGGLKENFLSTWKLLLPLYKNFNARLESERSGYSGALYRKVAQNLDLLKPLKQYKEVVFIGFNLLSKSEKKVMEQLKIMELADFYWDYNFINRDDSQNVALRFRDENLLRFPSKREFFPLSKKYPRPVIEAIETVSPIMQAKVAGELLKTFKGDESGALVLPDESLLDPLLSAIPNNIESINISMGYPLKATAVASFFKTLLELVWSDRGLYYKKGYYLLNHPITLSIEGEYSRAILNRISRENIRYISSSMFEKDSFLALLFSPPISDEPQREISQKMLAIIERIAQNSNTSQMDKEFLFHIESLINRLETLLPTLSATSYAKLTTSLIWKMSIPFSGEPLEGVQVMGLIESRALDFDDLIICSLNEGFFPKSNLANSFIPYSLKVGFGLPVREESDSLYSYLFYSLISRATRVYLVYDSSVQSIGASERSRYISQLKYLYGALDREVSVEYKIESIKREQITIAKDSEVMQKLQKFIVGSEEGSVGFSASALNSYLDCSLQFYFKYIQKIESEEELTEEMPANIFGNLFHYVIEQIYKPFVGELMDKATFLKVAKEREKMEYFIAEWFIKERGVTTIDGYNYIIKEIVLKYLEQTILWDSKLAPLHFIASEHKADTLFKVNSSITVSLYGVIDRIDSYHTAMGEKIKRVVDYKSGGKVPKNYTIDSSMLEALFDSDNKNRSRELFQLLFYATILHKELPLELELYFLRAMSSDKKNSAFISEALLEPFRIKLRELIEEIFNPELKFKATTVKERCQWCPFNSICG